MRNDARESSTIHYRGRSLSLPQAGTDHWLNPTILSLHFRDFRYSFPALEDLARLPC